MNKTIIRTWNKKVERSNKKINKQTTNKQRSQKLEKKIEERKAHIDKEQVNE